MVCVAVVVAFLYAKATAPDHPKLVAETLCPVDGPRSITVVLVDASDDIHEAGRREALTYLEDLADTLPDFGRLELRVLSPGMPGGRTVFDKCNPGDGSNLDQLVANPALARKRWSEGFRAPLESALQTELTPSEAETSPIIETIQNISVQRFAGRAAAAVPKRLVLISDMIENDRDYSQYRGNLTFERFKASAAYRRLRTDLKGAEVSIRYIHRLKPQIDSGAHIKFWEAWVNDSGGRLVDAEKLQGAG